GVIARILKVGWLAAVRQPFLFVLANRGQECGECFRFFSGSSRSRAWKPLSKPSLLGSSFSPWGSVESSLNSSDEYARAIDCERQDDGLLRHFRLAAQAVDRDECA